MTFEDKAKIVISQLRADRERLLNAIEDIKAEIDEHIQDCQLPQGHDPWWNGKKDGLQDALEIIDKHMLEDGE